MTSRDHAAEQQRYQIRVRGHLGETIRSAFPALAHQAVGGDTVLVGELADQAALYGVLAEFEAVGVEPVEVRRMPPDGSEQHSSRGAAAHGNGGQAEGSDKLQAALAARSALTSWSEGMELVELMRAAHDACWLERLRDATTAEELAAAQEVSIEQVSNVLAVVIAAGVVRADGASFRLSPTFDALVAGASGIELSAVLDALDCARTCAERTVQPIADPRDLDGEQAPVLARDWGVRPSCGARQLYGFLFRSLPEYRDRLEQGGPLLDVGSGVGGALLTTLSLFDTLHAVGVEVVPEIAAELRQRAKDAGVAHRVEIRAVDARALADEATFAVCYWAQAFFTTDARDATFAAILRVLRPDGLLLMRELFPPLPEGEPTGRALLDQLFFRQQDVGYGLSAEILAVEAITAGFRRAQIVDSPLGRLVLVRKPSTDPPVERAA